MTRTMQDQKFCGWCGSKIVFTVPEYSECTVCNYKNYINHKPCVNVIIENKSSILMLKRAIQPQLGKFDLPGGFMDITDKSIEDSGYRELNEEIGLEKEQLSGLIYFGSGTETYEWSNTIIDNVCFFFIATIKDPLILLVDKAENSGFKWVNKSDIDTIDFAWDIDKVMIQKYFDKKERNV